MSTKQPLVSIILCVYKVEDFIARCARSVFGQTYANIEYIFVDDGSPDRSIDIVRTLLPEEFPHLEHRVRIIRQENMGLGAARMAGLKEAKGEFVLFIDPDDWCKTTQVEKMVRAAVENDADMVICNYYYAYSHFRIPRREKRYTSRQDMLRALLCNHHLRGYLWDKLVRRELYTGPSLYYPKTSHCEDLVRTAQALFFARKVVYIRDRLVFYNRQNPNAVSKDDIIQKTNDVINNIMGMFMHYYGREDNPFKGIEEPALMSVTAQVLRVPATGLFSKYPVILEKCTPILEQLPLWKLRKDIPLSTQREMKELYRRSRD